MSGVTGTPALLQTKGATMASTSTTTSRSKVWKGVGAAGVAVALLAAGGATFAEWSDRERLWDGNTTVTSGKLTLTGGDNEGTWTNVAGTDVTQKITEGTYRIVPGDALTYREVLTLDAEGDLLQAEISHNMADVVVDGVTDSSVVAEIMGNITTTINTQEVAEGSAFSVTIDEKQDVEVVVTAAFPSDRIEGQVGQGYKVALGTFDVTVTQKPVTSPEG